MAQSVVQALRRGASQVQYVRSKGSLLEKCIYSKSMLKPNSYGPLIEEHIREALCMERSDVGDGRVGGHTIEIKVSLSDHRGRMNFVQLRPHQGVSFYVLVAWDMADRDALGKLWTLLVPAEDMHRLIVSHGHYAHGSLRELGPITPDTLASGQREFALRPCTTSAPGSKCRELWSELIRYQSPLPSMSQRLMRPSTPTPQTPPGGTPQTPPPPPRSDRST